MSSAIHFGDYRLIRRLGAGGMAEVFLAKRVGPAGFEKQLVIKRILPHLSALHRFTEMFMKEARLAALVDHPNLVHVSEFGEIGGEYYLAMEFVDGLTLAEVLKRLGSMSPGVACRIAVDLLEALHAIHSATDSNGQNIGLVHRDVSPRNVMVTREGAVKLLDFGIAASMHERTTQKMGTKRHMSPEQILGHRVDQRSDLFCVGLLLYQLISGNAPFDRTPDRVPDQPAEVPDVLWTLLKQSLSMRPEARPTTARSFAAGLELFLTSRGLEGTRAHLAETISSVMQSRQSTAGRVLSRVTRITRITHLTKVTSITKITNALLQPSPNLGLVSHDGAPLATIADHAFYKNGSNTWRHELRRRWLRSILSGVGALALGTWAASSLGIIGSGAKTKAAEDEIPMASTASLVPPSAASPPEPSPSSEAPFEAMVVDRVDEARSVDAESAIDRPLPISVGNEAPRRRSPSDLKAGATPRGQGSKMPASASRTLEPRAVKHGWLTIDTRPWTEVFIKGRRLGLTPMEGLQLPVGRHQLLLKNSELGVERTLFVVIRPGRVSRVQKSL